MKLYWRVRINGKWTWRPAETHTEVAPNGKRRMYIDEFHHKRVYKTQVQQQDEGTK